MFSTNPQVPPTSVTFFGATTTVSHSYVYILVFETYNKSSLDAATISAGKKLVVIYPFQAWSVAGESTLTCCRHQYDQQLR
jgi:hypothetical protein